MLQITYKTTAKPGLNCHGQSLVEALVSVFLLSVALGGSLSVYRTMRNTEKSAEQKYELALATGETRSVAAQLVMAEWLRVGQENCLVDPQQIPRLPGLVNDYPTLKIMDRTALEAIVPADVRRQIDQVISLRSTTAFASCSDSAFLAGPAFNRLAGNAFNQALCRCAAVNTGYETFKPPTADLTNYQGYYACVYSGASAEQAAQLIELSAHALNLTDGSRYHCSDLKNADSAKLLRRVDYTASRDGGAVSRSAGTYYLPLEGK